jgi:hypothetical protein
VAETSLTANELQSLSSKIEVSPPLRLDSEASEAVTAVPSTASRFFFSKPDFPQLIFRPRSEAMEMDVQPEEASYKARRSPRNLMVAPNEA